MRNIKWGVLGTAGIARGCTIPGMMQADNCIRYAIAGRNPDKVAEFKSTYGFEKTYLSYEELLTDMEVEAVYIPLPNQLHYEWVMKALEAGKHVLCEKPLAPTAGEAAELFAKAKEKGLILMEAFAYLHSPYIDALKAELEAHTIGDLCYLETTFLTSGYELTNIRMHRECFGGATYDLGCYCISLILRLLGQEPEKIQGMAEYTREGIDLFAMAMMQFRGGIRASFTCGMNLEKEMGRRFDHLYLHGSKGWIKSDTKYNEAGELKYTVCVDGREEVKTVQALHNYRMEVEQLGRCITEGEQPHVEPEFSIMTARTIERVLDAIGYNRSDR